MPGAKVRNTHGTTIGFGTTAASFALEVDKIKWSGIKRKAIDTSHMGTAAPGALKLGNATFLPGKITDPGELQVEAHFDPDEPPPIEYGATPLGGDAETITVTFPKITGDTTAPKWAASGFVTEFEADLDEDDIGKCSFKVKFSGPITVTPTT